MPREYRHIEQYEKEIIELKEKGLTKREIGERYGNKQGPSKRRFTKEKAKRRKAIMRSVAQKER